MFSARRSPPISGNLRPQPCSVPQGAFSPRNATRGAKQGESFLFIFFARRLRRAKKWAFSFPLFRVIAVANGLRCLICHLFGWEFEAEPGAFAGFGIDFEFTSEELGPFEHAGQAQPTLSETGVGVIQ